MSTDTDDAYTRQPPAIVAGTDVTAAADRADTAAAADAETEADRIESRAGHLLPEEEAAGSDDPIRQAAALLDESDRRTEPPG
ncbi:hypothetical protein [Micromonospora sp. LOL_023]|uniref:hypothetical protein n=1 Tax=Micromonospora sp. LOL_023 TaxID=3345418 RepID=UPI003A8AA28F